MDQNNKTLLSKWHKLAQDDLKVAVLSSDNGIYLQAAFHCQQAIEKSIKGLIIYLLDTEPPYTHDLIRLYKILENTKYYDPKKMIIFGGLNPFYIKSRYPSYKQEVSNNLTKQKITSFIKLAQEIEQWLENEMK